MLFCERCGVSVKGSPRKCPLCQANLSGTPDGGRETFPVIDTIYHRNSRYFQLLMFLFLTASIVSVAVNLRYPDTGLWSLGVVAGAACVWLSLVAAIRRRHGILKKLTDQAVLLSGLSVVWDALTGWHGWSIDFVIPIVFVCTMLIVSILARVMHLPPGSYVIYLVLLILFGTIPAVFVAAGWSRVDFPAYVCVTVSLISLSAMLIFRGRELREELTRRLHV